LEWLPDEIGSATDCLFLNWARIPDADNTVLRAREKMSLLSIGTRVLSVNLDRCWDENDVSDKAAVGSNDRREGELLQLDDSLLGFILLLIRHASLVNFLTCSCATTVGADS